MLGLLKLERSGHQRMHAAYASYKFPSVSIILQGFSEMLDLEGEEDMGDDMMLPASMKIRPQAGILEPGKWCMPSFVPR